MCRQLDGAPQGFGELRYGGRFLGTLTEQMVLEGFVTQLKSAPSLVDLRASFGVWDTTLKFILLHSQLDLYLRERVNDHNHRLLHILCVQELSTKVDSDHWRIAVSHLDVLQKSDFYSVLEALRATYMRVGGRMSALPSVPPRQPGQEFAGAFRSMVETFRTVVPRWYKPADAFLIVGRLLEAMHVDFYPELAEVIGMRLKHVRPAFDQVEELEGWFRAHVPSIDTGVSSRADDDSGIGSDFDIDAELIKLSLDSGSETESLGGSETVNDTNSPNEDPDEGSLGSMDLCFKELEDLATGSISDDSANSLSSSYDETLVDDSERTGITSDQLCTELSGDNLDAYDPNVLQSEKQRACAAELEVMRELKVFTPVPRPKTNVLPSRWVYTSVNPEAEAAETLGVPRLYARVAAQGRDQAFSDEHVKVAFTRPERPEVMVFLLAAAKNGWHLAQIAIRHPYFHTDIDSSVYIEQPDHNPYTVWKLNKGVLGLKQAPRLGWKAIKSAIQQSGYLAVAGQRGIYVRSSTNSTTFMLVNEDRVLIGSRNYRHVLTAKEKLAETFDIFESDANVYFGLNMVTSPRGLMLDSHMHTRRLVESFADQQPRYIEEYSEVPTVCDEESASFTLHRACSPQDVELARQIAQRKGKSHLAGMLTKRLVPKYQSGLTMVLNIARSTRPDLLSIATFLSQFTKPRNHHWNMLLKVVDYIQKTIHAELTLDSLSRPGATSGRRKPILECYVNAYAPNLYVTTWVLDDTPFIWAAGFVPGSKKVPARAVVTGCAEALRENRSLRYVLTTLECTDAALPITVHYTGKASRKDLLRTMHYMDLRPKHKRPYKDVTFCHAENDAIVEIMLASLGLDS